MLKCLGRGVGGVGKVTNGEVIDWSDEVLENPSIIENMIVYNKGSAPLYRLAFLIDNNVKAVLMEEGGKNYHPLILLNDAEVPAIAGIGDLNLSGKNVTIDSRNGIIFEGEVELENEIKRIEIETPKIASKVYVNVGYPSALESAAKSGANGIGLLRTEFTAVRTLSKILNKKLSKNLTVRKAIEKYNEADVIYWISKDEDLREYLKKDLKTTIKDSMKYFGEKEIIIRTFDIARYENDPMGNRGIRRCIGEGGYTIRIIAEAIKDSLEEEGCKYNIGVILPLVSHYSQINTALNILLDSGLSLKGEDTLNKPNIMYGWEIEQPAASQNNDLWLEAFKAEYKRSPDIIGIGTNDLTQFTVALGRDAYTNGEDTNVQNYLSNLYDESDFSVIRQIYEVSKQCEKSGTRLFLLGQAAAKQEYAELMFAFNIIPSVDISSVSNVKYIASELEKRRDVKEEIIRKYIENLCDKQYSSVKSYIKPKILEIFNITS